MSDGLSYDVVGVLIDGRRIPHARGTCYSCDAHQTLRMAGANNPEAVAKWFVRKGWEFNGFHRNRNLCPACVASRAQRHNDPNSALKTAKVIQMQAKPEQKSLANPRPLTPKERGDVRAALELYFDIDCGSFRDGYSDQRIGDECNVPWAAVRDIRETAFGSITSDPQLDAIGAEVAKATKLLADARAQVASAEQMIRAASESMVAQRKRLGLAA